MEETTTEEARKMQRTTKDAKLVRENEHGVELRLATRKTDTWPGWHESAPLGKAGYWMGTEGDHAFLGRTIADLPHGLEEMCGFERIS